jgi:hypothetical protein
LEIDANSNLINKLLVREQLIRKQINASMLRRNTERALRLSYQRPGTQDSTSPASLTEITSLAFSRLVELEESLRGVHARQR